MADLLLPLVAVAAILAVGVIPTRRLALGGVNARWRAVYLAALVVLGLLAIETRALARVILPILLVLYALPFLGAPEALARRLRARSASRPPGRDPAPLPADEVIEGEAREIR